MVSTVGLLFGRMLVQTGVQTEETIGVTFELICSCDCGTPGLHPGGRGFETLSAQ